MATPQENPIQIDVTTTYIPNQSDPAENQYVFAYTIHIRNTGEQPAQLIGRHWIITNANGETQEVRGDGVVGEQPYLRPGESFRYTSGTALTTPVGSMQGSYRMRRDDGQLFEAPIAPFSLAVPNSLN